MDNHYTGTQAYYRSKFALAASTFDLTEELFGVTAVIKPATGPAGGTLTGRYFEGTDDAGAHEATYDLAIRSWLRTVTAELLTPLTSSYKSPGSRGPCQPDHRTATGLTRGRGRR
jgi:hypothetical protein